MHFSLKNIGLIKDATNVQIKNLTVVCGRNNTGKTYLTHSLYGALTFLREAWRYSLNKQQKESLLATGACDVDMCEVASQYWQKLTDDESMRLSAYIPTCLGKVKSPDTPIVNVDVSEETREQIRSRILDFRFDFPVAMHVGYSLTFKKYRGESIVHCKYEATSQINSNIYQGLEVKIPTTVPENVAWVIYYLITKKIPRPFIIGSERTGISIFREEFDLYRKIAYDDASVSHKVKEMREKFAFDQYPIAIRQDLDYYLQLPSLVNKGNSFLSDKYDVFMAFEGIAGGRYVLKEETGRLYFVPGNSSVELTLGESSSSVRALCELYFYLKYSARQGDILMVDEPEMNLHPEAQRKLARVLALISKNKIKVFITTHSEYIVREINALIRLNSLKAESKRVVCEKFGYSSGELLNRTDVAAYVLKDGVIKPIEPHSQYGFAISSFDDTINNLNLLYDEIVDAELDCAE